MITLNSLEIHNFNVSKINKKYVFNNDAKIIAKYTKNNIVYKLELDLKKGFRTDGASVPFIFQWFLPGWDKKNPIYNAAAVLHDVLYTAAGIDGYFTREECDDFFRGGVRVAGYGRFKAGVADVAIGLFAGSDEHWGSDDLKNKEKKLYSFVSK